MATKSTFDNMLLNKKASPKVMDEDDMPKEPLLKEPTRGVRSPKAGKTKSTYSKMLKGKC